jgi:hypothetical protein
LEAGLDKSLADFREVWDKAEARIKRTERLNTKLTIPAVNELRYAGYHLLRAVTYTAQSGDDDNAQQSLHKGILHCRRSTYDAVDAEAMLYLERARKFEDEYRGIVIDLPGFDYVAVRARVREARDVMGEARKVWESRDQYHQKMMEHCDVLKAAADSMEDASSELTKKKELAKATETRALKAERRVTIQICISIVAILAALSGWATYVWRKTEQTRPATTEQPIVFPPPSATSQPVRNLN